MSPPSWPWEEQEEDGEFSADDAPPYGGYQPDIFLGEKSGGSMWEIGDSAGNIWNGFINNIEFAPDIPFADYSPLPELDREEDLLVPVPDEEGVLYEIEAESAISDQVCGNAGRGSDDATGESPESASNSGALSVEKMVDFLVLDTAALNSLNTQKLSMGFEGVSAGTMFTRQTFPFSNLGPSGKSSITGKNARTISISFSVPLVQKDLTLVSYIYYDLESINQKYGTNFSNKKLIYGMSSEPLPSPVDPKRTVKVDSSTIITDIRVKDGAALMRLSNINTSLVPLLPNEPSSPIREFGSSLDADGNASFIFDLDMISALKQTSLGSIFSRNISPDTISEILQNTRILSMEVIRNRTDVQEDPVVIASSSQSKGRSLLSPITYKIRERMNDAGQTLGSISEMNMQRSSDIRTFSGMDYSLPQRGKYVYTVRVKISDSISSLLSAKLSSLKSSTKSAANFAMVVSGLNYSDDSRKSFSYKGSRSINKKYKNKNTPVEISLALYSEIAGDIFAADSPTAIIDIMYPYVNSITGNPQGVNSVVTAMKSLENKMSKLLDGNILTGQTNTGKGSYSYAGSMPSGIFEFERIFSNQELDSYTGDVAYTIITAAPNNFGVKVLSRDSYRNRIEEEISAYSDKKTIALPLNFDDDLDLSNAKISSLTNIDKNLPTYLTPSSVVAGTQTFDLSGANKWDEKAAISAAENIRAQKKGIGENENFSIEMLGELGITCEIFGQEKDKKGGIFEVDSQSGGNIFSPVDKFTSEDIEGVSSSYCGDSVQEAALEISSTLSPSLVNGLETKTVGTKLSLFDSLSEEFALGGLTLSEIQSLPSQLRCLFLSRSEDVKQNWLERSPESLDVVFNSIARVEYLSYTKDSNGGVMSEWKPLTQGVLSRSEIYSVRCRLKNYSNSKLGISQKDDLSATMLDKHFVIGGNNISKPNITIKNPTRNRMENKLSFQNKIIRNDLKTIVNRKNITGNSREAEKNKTSASTTPTSTTRARTTVSGMHRMPDGSLMADSEMPQASVASAPASTTSGMGGY